MDRLTQFLFDKKTVVVVIGVVLVGPEWDKTWPFVNFPAPVPELVQSLLRGFGEALIIAVALAFVVDAAAKQRLLQEAVKDVSILIIGRLLPPVLREYIEQYLRADLVRTSWTITYTITDWPKHPDYKRLETLSVYDIENRSSSPKPYDCTYEVEASLFPLVGDADIVQVTGTNLANSKVVFEYPDPQGRLKVIKTSESVTFSNCVTIPAAIGPSHRFTTKSVECFHDGSIVPFFSYYPVLSTTLIVLDLTHRMNVIVDLSFGDIKKDTELSTVTNGQKWVFKKPMLPGQGFTMRFAPLAGQGNRSRDQ